LQIFKKNYYPTKFKASSKLPSASALTVHFVWRNRMSTKLQQHFRHQTERQISEKLNRWLLTVIDNMTGLDWN